MCLIYFTVLTGRNKIVVNILVYQYSFTKFSKIMTKIFSLNLLPLSSIAKSLWTQKSSWDGMKLFLKINWNCF